MDSVIQKLIKLLYFISMHSFDLKSEQPSFHFEGEIAQFGAGIFLLIQLVSVISFIFWLNYWCLTEKYAERCRVHVTLTTTTTYIVSIRAIIMMYIWYAPEPACLQNIFFITWTPVLLQLMTSVSLQPRISARILTPGLMGLYIVFLSWCAIRSEPPGTKCNRKAEASARTDSLTIISFVIALLTQHIQPYNSESNIIDTGGQSTWDGQALGGESGQ